MVGEYTAHREATTVEARLFHTLGKCNGGRRRLPQPGNLPSRAKVQHAFSARFALAGDENAMTAFERNPFSDP
jgi:hypothetical protein